MNTLTPQQREILAKAHKWLLDTADLVERLKALHTEQAATPAPVSTVAPTYANAKARIHQQGYADGVAGKASSASTYGAGEHVYRKEYERGYTAGRKKSYDDQPSAYVPEGEGHRAYVDPPTKLGGIAMPVVTPSPKKRNGPIPCHRSYCKGYRDGVKGVTALPYTDPLKQESYNRGQATGRKTAAKLAEARTPVEPTL